MQYRLALLVIVGVYGLTLVRLSYVEAGAGQIEYYQDTASSAQTCNGSSTCTSGAGWYDMPSDLVQISNTDFTNGEDYLIMAWGSTNTSNINGRSGLRIEHGTTGFTESQSVIETDRTNSGHKYPYFWFTVWTAVAGEDITLQAYYDGTNNGEYEDLTLVAINAEDLQTNNDLKYDIQTTGGSLTTSMVNKASITWTPENAGDTWWVMGYGQMDTISTVDKDFFNAQLDIDAGSTTVGTSHIEGENTADTPIQGYGWATTFTAASHTAAIQMSDTVATNGQEWDAAGIFALRLNVFEDFDASATTGQTQQTYTASTWITDEESIALDPTSTGDFSIAG